MAPAEVQAAPESYAAPIDEAAVDFGVRETGTEIVRSLRSISRKLADMLHTAADDLTSLEVLTYTGDEMEKVTYDSKTHRFSEAASLRAMTRVSLDGDLLNLVPQRKGKAGEGEEGQVQVEIDDQLWTIHCELVDLAQKHRTEFVKAMSEVVGTLLNTLK
jgi:hypothetical protein